MNDPFQKIWAALDRVGCDPHGDSWKFRARCPAHDGDGRESLAVSVGADGRALLHCHAHQCSAEAIVSALGLELSDLFPPGHHRARRRRPPEGSPVAQLCDLLVMLDDGRELYVELRTDCPHCGSPATLVQVTESSIAVSCPGDEVTEDWGYTACTLAQYREALQAQHAGTVQAGGPFVGEWGSGQD